MASSICPRADELKAFAVGDLPEAKLEKIAAHVTDCQHCDSSLQNLDEYADGLVTELKFLNADRAEDQTLNVPQKLVEVARSVGYQYEDGECSDVLLDSGHRLARKLAEGPCRLGRFELEAELGVGSFGYVFRARDVELDRIVALKVQRAGIFADDEEIERFFREARSAAQLKHPAIVAIYDTGHTEEDVCYLVTEYIEGETLESQIQAGNIDHNRAAELVAEIADALAYAHEHHVIHRDMKPSNILIDAEGHPHIADFGLAKRDNGDTMTSEGRVMGTPAYMSPEQARGESHEVNVHSDIYSLGVILYEILTGERPFQGNRRMLLLQVLEDEPRFPRQLNDQIPHDLETICMKAMAKAPARRYQSSREFADDLHRFLAKEPILARPEGYGERLWRWCRRYPFAVSLFLAVAIGSGVGIVYLSSLSEYFVRQTALEGARMEAAMLDETWRFYSELIDGLNRNKVDVRISPHYTPQDGILPLPATFAIDMGERISHTDENLSARIYSRYPWPNRKDGGPQDEFERKALDWLEENRNGSAQQFKEYYEFREIDGHRWLLFAKPRLMEKSCLNCHNDAKSKSPKKDWHVGEVGGVFKIGRRLDRDIEATRTGLRGAFILMTCIAVVLLVIGVCVVSAKSRRSRSFRL
ncbi:protein kinase domain-containing protein [Gimesia aquarii]|uniref:non-specific serine/threonine protein kinase n=1 Tax=Gimesia aquarii TaxID=2527964 RepID=A0A517W0E2_9PLAN|nr:protein kinase [Gimesia aquarii]QDT98724.1 Serine/threonine-protein kinase PknB [Gimesia aquarii]